jgi:hypothetical protein
VKIHTFATFVFVVFNFIFSATSLLTSSTAARSRPAGKPLDSHLSGPRHRRNRKESRSTRHIRGAQNRSGPWARPHRSRTKCAAPCLPYCRFRKMEV